MNGDQPVSFRINPFGTALLKNGPMPEEAPVEPLVVLPNFEVVVQPYASLFARFQIGRIAERTAGGYASDNAVAMYKLTKRSIQSACEHGITLDEMLTFLREQGKSEPPQNVVATLCEWADQHGQVSLRSTVLLEAEEPALLEQIKRDKRVKLPQVEPLTETTWLVREGDASALAERLRKAGYGLTGDGDVAQAPLREHDLTVLFTALEFYNRACAALGIEGDVSGAMYQRVARLLSEKQLNRAYQTSHAALKRLREKLE